MAAAPHIEVRGPNLCPEADFGSLALLLFLLIAAAHVLGYLFTRLRQPRVIGEILAGVLLGPSLLGRFLPLAVTGASG